MAVCPLPPTEKITIRSYTFYRMPSGNSGGLKPQLAMLLRETFYARKQNASRVFAIVWASVCLSVCHTRDMYQNSAS